MSEPLYHKQLRLVNFTAFQDASFDFVPGINVFVGANGTGKTHVMKVIYAIQLTLSRAWASIGESLEELFQTRTVSNVIRLDATVDARAELSGIYGDHDWTSFVGRDNLTGISGPVDVSKPDRPVFIPAMDMMGHTKGFTEAYAEVRLDFDLTCRDIVNLLRLERKSGSRPMAEIESLAKFLGGEIERDDDGRFFLVTKLGRQPMPMVAEGLRKIATLVQLQRNGWLTHGTTLLWDEPEVNLNPILMDEVIGALLALARTGVQIFLTTHSYVILKELDLQTRKKDTVRFFGFEQNAAGTIVRATDDFASLQPNPILDQYDSLYDRDLTRATGRNRNGELVRSEQD